MIATALGLFNSSNAFAEEFPTDRINWSRSWKMAELIPFLGHVGIEKLTCGRRRGALSLREDVVGREDLGGAEGDGEEDDGEYIRIIANSAPRPIPLCQDGPGASCGFDRFRELVRVGMDMYGDFDGVCGNEKDDAHGVGEGG